MKIAKSLSIFSTLFLVYGVNHVVRDLIRKRNIRRLNSEKVKEKEAEEQKLKEKQMVAELREGRNITKGNDFLDDIEDLKSMDRVYCGAHKCFFPSKTSPNSYGYVVTSLDNHPYFYQTLTDSLNDAMWIENELGGKTLYHTEDPFVVELPKDMHKKINKKSFFFERNRKQWVKSLASETVVVKKTKKMPQDSLHFGCFFSKIAFTYPERLDEFSENVCLLESLDTFVKNMDESIEIARQVFEERHWLMEDFQAIIDTSGNLLYFDLEKHFEMTEKNYGEFRKPRMRNGCLRRIENVKNNVIALCTGQK